jgi:hypothetical protein
MSALPGHTASNHLTRCPAIRYTVALARLANATKRRAFIALLSGGCTAPAEMPVIGCPGIRYAADGAELVAAVHRCLVASIYR